MSLARELSDLLNRNGEESRSGTPDFVLARYMLSCLEAFHLAVRWRDSLTMGKISDQRGIENGGVSEGRVLAEEAVGGEPGSAETDPSSDRTSQDS